MRLGVLFSGGKDSCLAYHKTVKFHDPACLLTMVSKEPASYMFHTPAISWTHLQAEALGVPLITRGTDGKKESELGDLKALMEQAKEEFAIEGIVTGAVASVYQASRVQRLCAELGLWCFNPLWQYPQEALLKELLQSEFEVMVVGVAAEPLGEEWLGRQLDKEAVKELLVLADRWGLNPAGEGGELETFVLNAPLFKFPIQVIGSQRHFHLDAGVLEITKAELGTPEKNKGPDVTENLPGLGKHSDKGETAKEQTKGKKKGVGS